MNMAVPSAPPAQGTITDRTVAALSVGQGHRDLGPGARRVRGPALPLGRQGLRRAGAGAGRVQAHHRGPPRGDRGERGAQARHPHPRPHQGGRRPCCGGSPARERHRRGPRRPLPAGARGGALQAHDRSPVPACHRALHRARRRHPPCLLPRPFSGRRPAARAPRPARHGQPGGRDALTHDRPCDGLGRGGGDQQPLPVRPKISDAPARALPHRRGVPAARPGAGRDGGGGAHLSPRSGGAAPAHAHRLPAQRDPDAPLGGRATGGAGAASQRLQNRPAHGHALARSGGCADRDAAPFPATPG